MGHAKRRQEPKHSKDGYNPHDK